MKCNCNLIVIDKNVIDPCLVAINLTVWFALQKHLVMKLNTYSN